MAAKIDKHAVLHGLPGAVVAPPTVRVRALKDDVILNPWEPRVKKGAVVVMGQTNASEAAAAGLVEILGD